MADVRCDRCGTEWVGIGLHTNGDCATIAAIRIDLTSATERAERAEGRLSEHDEARRRAYEALRGVMATEAGGLTGDPIVDAINTLRTRAEQAEADVRAYQKRCADFEDALNRAEAERDDWNARWHKLAEQTFAAEAEVARLRGELDRLRVTTADIETMRQMTEDVRAIGARSEALAREAALREAAGVCERIYADHCGDADECHEAILALLDAPAAEVSDG